MRKIRNENKDIFGDGDLSLVEHHIVSARAARQTGLIDLDVDEARLADVVAAGKAVWDAYDEAMRIDPN
jgi:hypothetical protein